MACGELSHADAAMPLGTDARGTAAAQFSYFGGGGTRQAMAVDWLPELSTE
jgi:hypothetical protein